MDRSYTAAVPNSLKNHNRIQTKMGKKSMPVFKPNRRTPPPPPPGWGGTLAHSLHGVGGGRPLGDRDKREEDFPFLISKANMGNISTSPGFVHDFRSPKYCVPDVHFLALPFSYFMKSE